MDHLADRWIYHSTWRWMARPKTCLVQLLRGHSFKGPKARCMQAHGTAMGLHVAGSSEAEGHAHRPGSAGLRKTRLMMVRAYSPLPHLRTLQPLAPPWAEVRRAFSTPLAFVLSGISPVQSRSGALIQLRACSGSLERRTPWLFFVQAKPENHRVAVSTGSFSGEAWAEKRPEDEFEEILNRL